MSRKSCKRMVRQTGVLLMALVLTLGAWFGPGLDQAFAAVPTTIKMIPDTAMAIQGEADVSVYVDIENASGNTITLKNGTISGKNIANGKPKNDSINIGSGSTEQYEFLVDIPSGASTGTEKLSVSVEVYNGDALLGTLTGETSIRISKKDEVTSRSSSIDLDYSLSNADGLVAGETTTISVTLFNRGSSMLSDLQASLTLPEGMSIDNSVGTVFVGYMMTGERRTIKFPVYVDKKMENKNYPISVKVEGTGYDSAASFERTLYIPVIGGEGQATFENLVISGITLPQQAPVGDDFTLTFNVRNDGTQDVKDIKVTAAAEGGLINKSKNIFIESEIKAGAAQSYSVTFFSEDNSEQKSYPIKISIEPAGTETNITPVVQYASIFLLKSVDGDEKTPQLIVDNYSYGGSYVQANDNFSLNIGLYNTSGKDISNIKVTLSAEDGAFVPVGSSNSFYMEKIGKKSHVSRQLTMSVKPTAEQKTTAINVEMKYEDGEGNEFTATDVISIPVIQETRLTVDEPIQPPMLFAGQQSGVSVNFYNTGKTRLTNLRVTAEGDFDTFESVSYYVGNMESGQSDSYDFGFIPRAAGQMRGTMIFTYEDPSGNEQVYTKEFEFTISEEVPYEDPWGEMPIEPEPGASKTPYIILGALAAAIVAAIVIMRILKRRKLHQEMEIDE